MKFVVWAQTDVGLRREINQDSILVDHILNLYIVADGMGGHKGGEVASAMAIEIVQDTVRDRLTPQISAGKVLESAYRQASSRIHFKSTNENPELMGMGTTLVGILGYKNKVYIANVGDSRAYLIRGTNMWQLTEDHSLINEQVRAGVIAEDDAPHVMGRNVITRSVGFERDVNVDVLERPFEVGDCYLLCSDGLSSLVEDHRIMQVFTQSPEEEFVSRCIIEAKKSGGDDNISVIFIKAVEDSYES